MKKKLLWILGILLVVILAVGGYALYVFKFKEYDVADPAVEEVVEDGFEVKLPDGTTVKLDQEGNVISGDSSTSTSTPNETPTEPSDATNETPTTNDNTTGEQQPAETKPTVASIKDKYRPTLEDLGAQANSKLNSLIGTAKNEYSTKKANGESISIPYFYQKYMGAAQGLEANTDAAFYSLLSIIEADLAQNGFDKSHAQSFVQEYEASKKAREDALMSTIKSNL